MRTADGKGVPVGGRQRDRERMRANNKFVIIAFGGRSAKGVVRGARGDGQRSVSGARGSSCAGLGHNSQPRSSRSQFEDVCPSSKVVVLYKSHASDEDKARVRSILHGKVTTEFKDRTGEEITVSIPSDQDAKKYVQSIVKAANQDPAVAHAYKSPDYTLQ